MQRGLILANDLDLEQAAAIDANMFTDLEVNMGAYMSTQIIAWGDAGESRILPVTAGRSQIASTTAGEPPASDRQVGLAEVADRLPSQTFGADFGATRT